VRKSDSRAQNVLSAPIRATLAPVQPNVPPVEMPDPEQVLSSSDRGTELTLKEESMDSRSPAQSLTLLEAGFKILPGKEEGFFALQQKMVPVAAKQPGFLAVYGGLIHASNWLYFGVRFETQADMETWHLQPQHQAMQKQAYAKWWSAVYLRKWRQPVGDEQYETSILVETRIRRAAVLEPAHLERVTELLGHLSGFGAKPFETLTGEFEAQPYQFVGPLEIAPAADAILYSLITHWNSLDAVEAWEASSYYHELMQFGEVSSDKFIPFVETGERDGMREDRLHRQWLIDGQPV
jgi:antibiotic biosynthesis monooxygenase (ABM) superfamily enzyme